MGTILADISEESVKVKNILLTLKDVPDEIDGKKIIRWFTMNGARVPVVQGQTIEQAKEQFLADKDKEAEAKLPYSKDDDMPTKYKKIGVAYTKLFNEKMAKKEKFLRGKFSGIKVPTKDTDGNPIDAEKGKKLYELKIKDKMYDHAMQLHDEDKELHDLTTLPEKDGEPKSMARTKAWSHIFDKFYEKKDEIAKEIKELRSELGDDVNLTEKPKRQSYQYESMSWEQFQDVLMDNDEDHGDQREKYRIHMRNYYKERGREVPSKWSNKSVDSENFWDDVITARIRRRYLKSVGADLSLKDSRWNNLPHHIRSLIGKRMNHRRWGNIRSLNPVYDADANVVPIPSYKKQFLNKTDKPSKGMAMTKIAPVVAGAARAVAATAGTDDEDDNVDKITVSGLLYNIISNNVTKAIETSTPINMEQIDTEVTKDMDQTYIDNFHVGDTIITPIGVGMLVKMGVRYGEIATETHTERVDLAKCIKKSDAICTDKLTCWDRLSKHEKHQMMVKFGGKDLSGTTWNDMNQHTKDLVKSEFGQAIITKSFKCLYCNDKFVTKSEYDTHAQRHVTKDISLPYSMGNEKIDYDEGAYRLARGVMSYGGQIPIHDIVVIIKDKSREHNPKWKSILEQCINTAIKSGYIVHKNGVLYSTIDAEDDTLSIAKQALVTYVQHVGETSITDLIKAIKQVDPNYASWKNKLQDTINQTLSDKILRYIKESNTIVALR